MNKLGFFTPVRYDGQEKSVKEHIFEGIEDYFSLGGKKAYIIPGQVVDASQEVEIENRYESKSKKILLGVIKVVSYMTGIIPIIMLVAKAIFRGTHKFHTIPTATLLQAGIEIKDMTVSKIQSCMKKILQCKEEDGVHLYKSQDDHRVFSLDIDPDLVFKMKADNAGHALGRDDSIKARYQSMIKAKTVCRTHKLGLLVIPNAKLFTVNVDGKDYDIIAEQKMDIDPDESAQEKHYDEHSALLNETIRQLAVFVAKTGFSDVEWRNVPILNNSLDENGHRKIALIDIEDMQGASMGIFGDGWPSYTRGLIQCVNEEQIDIVIEEARKQGVVDKAAAQKAKNRRLEELTSGKQLKQFYKTKNIVTGKEPIQVDLDSLGLDLQEEAQIKVIVGVENDKVKWEEKTVRLRDVAEKVIDKMNTLIQDSPNEKSVKGKRYFVLDISSNPLHPYNTLGLPSGKLFMNEEEEKQLWLHRIIQALVEKAHIFKLDKVNGYGYFVQA